MSKLAARKLGCAVYTRKSSEEGLEQEVNSLDAQREACEAYVAKQRSERWVLISDQYDDRGISDGTLDRPALKRRLSDIEDGLVDVVIVYGRARSKRRPGSTNTMRRWNETHGRTPTCSFPTIKPASMASSCLKSKSLFRCGIWGRARDPRVRAAPYTHSAKPASSSGRCMPDKTTIALGDRGKLPEVLDVVITAAKAGELDTAIEVAKGDKKTSNRKEA